MKKNTLKKIAFMLTVALIIGTVAFSCKKKVDPPVEPPVEDGIYIKGAGTALTTFNSKGLLKTTRNEVNQTERAALKEIYVAVKAGTDGFNIVEVAGTTRKTYGPASTYAVVLEAARTADEPKLNFWRGGYAENTNKFTVPTDGLYHVVIDTELKKIVVVPVQYWGLIGAATPGGWSNDTQLPSKGFDLNTITFEKTDVTMTNADFKFRYSGGWKVVIDDNFDLGGGLKGIRVNTNFGGTVAALVPGGANINNAVNGKYTAKMVWTLGQPYVATMTKTGDLQVINYTNHEMGLVGAGLMVNNLPHNWDQTIMLHKPVVTNVTNYTWTYSNVTVRVGEGGFKIRQGQDWNGKVIGYPQVTMAGSEASKFETNTDGNFVAKTAGTYNMVLVINAVTEVYTFTITPGGAAPELYMLGDGCSAGWNNTAALPLTGTGGVYTITTNLLGTGKFIKFIKTLGQWAPMYGTNASGTSASGVLVYRATENDPDPASIPCPTAAGNYRISVNTTALTYTIVAAK